MMNIIEKTCKLFRSLCLSDKGFEGGKNFAKKTKKIININDINNSQIMRAAAVNILHFSSY